MPLTTSGSIPLLALGLLVQLLPLPLLAQGTGTITGTVTRSGEGTALTSVSVNGLGGGRGYVVGKLLFPSEARIYSNLPEPRDEALFLVLS
jgi:hypothetical protein